MTSPDLPETVSIAALAGLLGVTTRQARNLLEQSNVKPAARGSWPLADGVRAILANARRSRETDALAAARARAINAKARQAEIAIGRDERELIPIDEAIAEHDALVAAVREAMDSIPARVTRDRDLRRKIEIEVHAAKLAVQRALGRAHDAARNGPSPEV